MKGQGELRERLLAAVDEVLQERGLESLSLREVARRAGVSHAAPAWYFRDKAALLTAYGALGLRRFGEALREGLAQAGPDPADQLAGVGRAYIEFALTNPGVFELLGRRDLLDESNPELAEAMVWAWAPLGTAVREAVRQDRLSPEQARLVAVAAWALVHGFAGLAAGGRLPGLDHAAVAREVCALFAGRTVGR